MNGNRPLRREGPSIIPARISPTTEGCPSLWAISPHVLAARSRTATWKTSIRISSCRAAEKTSITDQRLHLPQNGTMTTGCSEAIIRGQSLCPDSYFPRLSFYKVPQEDSNYHDLPSRRN